MNIEHEFHELCDALKGRNLQVVWWATESFYHTFSERKECFFLILSRLLNEKKIYLAKHGILLNGTVDEQIARFRQVFPKSEDEMEDGFWFFDEGCPGGAVWLLEDGSLEWT
ncbi:DUF596 domain-containing protein [Salmonella enterica]|uniref:DUF596 domain-containing protein n=2 Tax=Salmonella enterica TaxID=28901 RepID=F2Q970_SALET|nr:MULTISPECIES: DUF596 domain-containing protein [Enterobacteriaceae]EKG5011692.1 DUF596 domain-containing protein [Salmonella enterica]CAX68166.1 conserved hypothetical protein [Salmonella enterica subsp. enterica] [Salmonella enterica subsp. enterica serovar Senftenberg]HAB1649521.1 DUF596 domain-containing protein [Salmonella enterica subsp. enterica]EBY8685145.1 DUF596 domain-containing protein [Salmonella enterica subsp. enterica serovar Agona]EHW1978101.1 DUF596 domain-containing protei